MVKRWDTLDSGDEPLVVVFFATPDVLAGLFTLAIFDESDLNGVIAPMGSGCASIVQYPLYELQSQRNRPVLGMFNISARSHVPHGILSFSVPWPKFVRMVDNVEQSFILTKSWEQLKVRLS